MFVHALRRSLSLFSRWSRDRMQHHLLKIRRLTLARLLIYSFVIFLFVFYALVIQVPKSNSLRNQSPQQNVIERGYQKGVSENGANNEFSRQKGAPVVINPHNFHVMINPKICRQSDMEVVNLLIMVASAPSHFEQRASIRETWGKKPVLDQAGVKIVFMVANPNNLQIQKELVEEYRTHGDILQEDFIDSYLNLTLKTVMGIKWASRYCHQAHFVMKTDDDIFVNVPLLLHYILSIKEKNVFLGCIKQKKSFKPVNVSPGVQLPVAHPPFAAGAGYVFSGSLLKRLYEASLRRQIVPIEDVYVTGHLAKIVGAHPPVHDQRFSCGEMVIRECHLASTFTGHKITPDRMRNIWLKLTDSTNSCSPEAS